MTHLLRALDEGAAGEMCGVQGPAATQPPVIADRAGGGPGDRVETLPAVAEDAWWPRAGIRGGRACFLGALVFCLVLCSAGEAVGNKVAKGREPVTNAIAPEDRQECGTPVPAPPPVQYKA